MIDRMLNMKAAAPALRVVAVLGLLVAALPGVAMPVAAQGTEMIYMEIGANGPNGWEIGARFTVTTMDGVQLGSCTTEGVGDEPWPIVCVVDVPLGTTVIVTLNVTTITPGYAPVENPVYFDTSTGPGGASLWGVFFDIEPVAESVGAAQDSDIAIETTENGASATDVCYVLVDFSNEGCDRNGDGQVTFDDVPVGTYTVRQTADLGAGRSVTDFTIQVTGATVARGYEVFAATVTGSGGGSIPLGGAKDISLITRDPDTGDLLTGTCYVLVGYSNEGCDENGDGQVTFDAIPYGTWTVRQTRTPVGYPTIDDFPITVDDTASNVPAGYIVKQAPLQNMPGMRNVSLLFIDSRTEEKVVPSPICIQIGDVSNVGCDRDLIDGQIDFLDVRTGTHELTFSDLPPGWQVMGGQGAFTITVEAGSGPQSVLIGVYVPGDASVGTGSGPAISGQGGYGAMVGEWYGKRRTVLLYADGTGVVDYRRDAFGNGVTYDIVVHPGTPPLTATIVGVTPYGDLDPSDYPTIGHTITLELESYPDGNLLIVEMNHDGWTLHACAIEDNVQNMCH